MGELQCLCVDDLLLSRPPLHDFLHVQEACDEFSAQGAPRGGDVGGAVADGGLCPLAGDSCELGKCWAPYAHLLSAVRAGAPSPHKRRLPTSMRLRAAKRTGAGAALGV